MKFYKVRAYHRFPSRCRVKVLRKKGWAAVMPGRWWWANDAIATKARRFFMAKRRRQILGAL